MAKRGQDVSDVLLRDPNVADKLRLADNYMLQMQRFGNKFVLPDEHQELEPIIKKYARDLPRFVSLVRSIRDQVPPKKPSYIALHELYRMLEVRLVQQTRRERARKALNWVERHHAKLTHEQKMRWLRKLEQQWGKQRMQYLEAERRKTERGRLSTEEREELLKQFWAEIDEQVENGELPTP